MKMFIVSDEDRNWIVMAESIEMAVEKLGKFFDIEDEDLDVEEVEIGAVEIFPSVEFDY